MKFYEKNISFAKFAKQFGGILNSEQLKEIAMINGNSGKVRMGYIKFKKQK